MPSSATRAYFESIRQGTTEPQRAAYADDAVARVHGVTEDMDRDGLVAWFEEIWAAFPDFRMEVVEYVEQGPVTAVRWRATGTFAGPGPYQGLQPNGARIDIGGVDVVEERDGRLIRNDVYLDGISMSRQLGLLPPAGSATEQRMTRALTVRDRIAAKIANAHGPEEVADGVWRVQGEPGRCNVYLVRDGAGVLMFDAGARTMTSAVAKAAAQLGGLTRIVLGHGHTDHRGTAPAFDVPVLCHPDEVVDAEGSGGWRYWDRGLKFLPAQYRALHRFFHDRAWDGGPVKITGTVTEGDDVAGFRVVHIPGHAPGLIALFRESDGVALTSDAFYTLDMLGRDREPGLPVAGYNLDTERARVSLRKLAALEPSVAHPGHAEPVRGNVREQLERAAGSA